MQEQILLNQGWTFRQKGTDAWLPAKVPGNVHSDLLRHGKIPSPYFGTNEHGLQWIDKTAWEYQLTWTLDRHQSFIPSKRLIFDGLDTYAQVWLNDTVILSADNMFRTYTIDVSDALQRGINHLRVVFSSPTLTALKKQKQYGIRLPAVNDQAKLGQMGRHHVSPFIRKAPYHFGWDWGPRLVTSGIWRPVRLLLSDTGSLDDVFIRALAVSVERATLAAQISFLGIDSPGYCLQIIHADSNQVLASQQLGDAGKEDLVNLEFDLLHPDLWYPNGYGRQALTGFRIELVKDSVLVDTRKVSVGIRSVELVRKADDKGKSFFFKINGIPIFAKGANYIPNDLFLTEVGTARYRHVLESAARANMNMIRVWGGGIYENDLFYTLCDQLGLMVWQDFMFACSMYPGTPEFIETVRHEAVDNVRRLRNHACIVLWCGNNEIDTAWSPNRKLGGWGWKQRYSARQREKIWAAYETLFHQLLPQIVAQYDGTRAYWPSSPLADWGKTADYATTSGDMHYWGVWHNDAPFEEYGKIKARFMSEYGLQSFPQLSTVYTYTRPEDRILTSAVMQSHQRCSFGNSKILAYLGTYLPGTHQFEETIYASQFLQAYGIERAIELHRLHKPYTMGTLFWQLNDCWPVASWSSLDYYGNWKGLHYRARTAFKPIRILNTVMPDKVGCVQIWVVSDLRQSRSCCLQLQWIDVYGTLLEELNVSITASFEKTLLAYTFERRSTEASLYRKSLLVARLLCSDQILDEKIIWFDIPKKLALPHADIVTQVTAENGDIVVSLSAAVAVMGLALDFKALAVPLSDNYFDLLPGETKRVKVLDKDVSVDKIARALSLFCINNLSGSSQDHLMAQLYSIARRCFFKLLRLIQ